MIKTTTPTVRMLDRGHSHPVDNDNSGEILRFGKQDEFVLRMATTEEDRLKCWYLVYKQYLVHGYVEPQALEYRYSLHDMLPDTGTFLIERRNEAIGTITIYPDSPLGLPADDIYRAELDVLRETGCRLAEIGRLTICPEYAKDREVLMQTVEIPCLYSRSVLGATHSVITVNPRHESFYRRMMLFNKMGREKGLASVGGAPAVLLQIDLAWQRELIDWAKGMGSAPCDAKPGGRRVYRCFATREDEDAMSRRIRYVRTPPDRHFIERYFIKERSLISELDPSRKAFFAKCYPACPIWGEPSKNGSVPENAMEGSCVARLFHGFGVPESRPVVP